MNQMKSNLKQPEKAEQKKRSGFLTMELVMVLPILLIILFALFEFSILFYARGNVSEASRAGARTASLPGVDQEEIRRDVLRILKPRMRSLADIEVEQGKYSGDPVSVTVRVPMRIVSPDLLWPIGYSLKNRDFISETRMMKE
jgi:TadE-like protein